ncbi:MULTISPECIES: hypothetical protein [Pseudanabaena]|nr:MULTISPECIES: hypothetical protein [Pseudanabaena]MEA5490102.1 hypothetical protein [Pseudanabaena sp. CCNP1317]WGS73416.1 hypothetical protein OA858_05135 [Pseudanabaena galeata CCNP1313]
MVDRNITSKRWRSPLKKSTSDRLSIEEDDDYYWFWIGLHDEYEGLIDES